MLKKYSIINKQLIKNKIDQEFFQSNQVKACTNGNSRFADNDFTRVKLFPFQQGSNPSLGGKKEHKKKARQKNRTNWTKME
jgi:hypothetical protein